MEHKGSRETYDYISNWANTRFPFSLSDGWDRFGILGVLGDVALLVCKEAHILEIGVGESSIYLTELARRHKRKIFHCDISEGKIVNPMTISGYLHENRILVKENLVTSEYKNYDAVLFHGTSDKFFAQLEIPKIGIAFIEGDHTAFQVRKDFENVFKLLDNNGIIFLHDMSAYEESLVLNDYCSDSYKVREELEKRTDIDCFTFPKLLACNVGITMCRKKSKERFYFQA